MVTALKLLFATILLLDARVSTLDEQQVDGELLSIDDLNVTLRKDKQEHSIPLANVTGITVTTSDAVAEATNGQHVLLGDGSALSAENVSATAQALTITSSQLGELTISRDVVRAVRLLPLKPEWSGEWDAFLKRDNKKDMVIVPKKEGGLDFVAGVVVSIGDKTIPLLLDGSEIPVPRERVLGILFAAKEKEEQGLEGDVLMSLHSGDSLRVRSVKGTENELTLKTSWGQTVNTMMAHVASIDFSGGRIHQLSDLEPITEVYFGLDPPAKSWGPLFEDDADTRTGLSRQWKMSRDRFPNSGRPRLTLRGRAYAKGLCLFPSAKVEYALDRKYTRLTALAGVDDEVAFNQLQGKPPTMVELRIEADGKEVYRRLIKAPEDPVHLDLPLTGVNTLSVFVDFGDGASTCDYLDIVNARLFVDNSE